MYVCMYGGWYLPKESRRGHFPLIMYIQCIFLAVFVYLRWIRIGNFNSVYIYVIIEPLTGNQKLRYAGN